jgi:two-component system, NtrC family, nitrogen regulation sensor histidine kinase NtrY
LNLRNLNTRLPKRTLLFTAGALLLLSLFTSFYFRENPSTGLEKSRLETYLHHAEKDCYSLMQDSLLLKKLEDRTETLEEFKSVANRNYGFFLYSTAAGSSPKLLFWSNQQSLPPQKIHDRADGEYFEQLANGYYVIIKRTLPGSNAIAYGMIPVMYKFEYEHSGYLKTKFVHDKTGINKIEISGKKTDYVIRSLSTSPLFYITAKPYNQTTALDTLTALLRILALILILGYIHFAAESFAVKKGPLYGIAFLFGMLLLLRVLLLLFPGVFALRQFELFNSTIYGNFYTWFNRSLGDLLINAVFTCWFVVYTWFHIGSIKRFPSYLYGKRSYITGIAGIFLLIVSTFQFANVVRSLVRDSKISFNVIDFFSLDVYTVIGFIVLAMLSLAYYYLTRLLFRLIFPAFPNSIYVYFFLAFTGLVFLTLKTGNNIVLFQLPVLAWLLIYTLLVNQENFIVNRFKITIAGVLFWIFLFSVSLAVVILGENKEKELKFRKAMAEKYDQLTDPSGELTLSIALAYLDNDFLKKNFSRFREPVQNRILRDSIISENITGYLNKYYTKVFVFDSLNHPVNNTEAGTFSELNNLFTVQSKPTGIPDLYYHETAYDQFTYITKRTIKDSGVLGTFFIISTPKKYNTDALYPELFRRISETDAENSPIYSYAIYNKGLLIGSSSKYSFAINLKPNELPVSEFERRINGDYEELWYKPNTRKVVIVAKKRDSLIESITLFSYLFCAFLLLVAVIKIISIILQVGNDRKALTELLQLNIRTQVHSTIIFISILSFLVIGVATISFFVSRYKRNNIDKLSRTAGIMVKEMQKRIATSNTFDDVIRIYDSVTNTNLQKLIDEVAEIHNVDVNVYDLEGNLQVSSEPEVYKRGLLSSKIHPEAFYHLSVMRQVQYVQDESLSSLKYLSIYAAVRDEKGQVYAYLNIPYFLSQIDVNQEISNFLVTIINLNAFIFLIAGIVALIITNRITRSFSLIGDKMKEIRLGGENEEIKWPRNDEIGELVKQYNKMVRQLEQSANALAKSEREGAWREMARQVAHEIKNPLTPMKLSIQYLQKAVSNNLPNVKELTTSVANTLVEQIDHLSKISSDFARFANIANTHAEVFDLHLVLNNLRELHTTNPRVELLWEKTDQPLTVRADRTHMNRLFTNLITNAIEACSGKQKCYIKISEAVNNGNIFIRLQDNGEGIPEEMRSKIFTPNFTTKSSGTGLGLAMCKSIVEQAGGRIWFETEQGKGTTFFVELPLVS